MRAEERLEELKRQEERLRFDHFTNEDAIALSAVIAGQAEAEGAAVCYQVHIGDFPVVTGFLTGTGPDNIIWLERKKNTVLKSGKSSLRCGAEAELGISREEWYGDEERYVIRGGGFPVRMKGGELAGAVCVSGLRHEEDHRLLVRSLELYLREREDPAGAESGEKRGMS